MFKDPEFRSFGYEIKTSFFLKKKTRIARKTCTTHNLSKLLNAFQRMVKVLSEAA